MTVTTILSSKDFVTNGATTVFPFNIQFFRDTDLQVTKIDPAGVETLLTLGTHYTVQGAGSPSGGSITTLGTPLPTGTLLVERVLAAKQETDLRNQGSNFAENHERVFDRLTMLIQQVISGLGNALQLTKGKDRWDFKGKRGVNVGAPVDATDAATKAYADAVGSGSNTHAESLFSKAIRTPENIGSLPGAAIRAGKLLAFDGAGNPSVGAPAGGPVADAKQIMWARSPLSSAITTVQAMADGQCVNVWEFEAMISSRPNPNDPSTWLWTPAIQGALDYVELAPMRIRRVYLPGGSYQTGVLFIPRGVDFFGDGAIENGLMAATRLSAAAGLNQDVIRFKWQNDGGSRRFWFGAVRKMSIFGSVGNLVGWGISLRADDGIKIAPQDTSVFEDLVIRRCPSGGMEFPDGALPLCLNRIKLLFNGGPGIHLTGGSYLHQSLDLMNISGDGNAGGLIKLTNFDRNGSVNIYNLKSERRINADFGSGAQQENAIVVENCDGTPVNIFGATHISSIPSGAVYEKPGSLIKITGGLRPAISWAGVAIRVRPTDIGADPYVVEDPSGVAVPYDRAAGRYGHAHLSDVTIGSGAYRTFGPVSKYQAASVEATGDQVSGVTPGRSLYEIDAAEDTKMWLVTASNGQLQWRAVSDDGSVTSIFLRANRTGAVVTSMDHLTPFRPHVLTISGLPSATALQYNVLMVSNPATGKGHMVYSDGSVWRYVSDGSTV